MRTENVIFAMSFLYVLGSDYAKSDKHTPLEEDHEDYKTVEKVASEQSVAMPTVVLGKEYSVMRDVFGKCILEVPSVDDAYTRCSEEFLLLHEFSHIRHDDPYKAQCVFNFSRFAFISLGAVYYPEHRLSTFLAASILPGTFKSLYGRYAEQRADDEAIDSCSDEGKVAAAMMFSIDRRTNALTVLLKPSLSSTFHPNGDAKWHRDVHPTYSKREVRLKDSISNQDLRQALGSWLLERREDHKLGNVQLYLKLKSDPLDMQKGLAS